MRASLCPSSPTRLRTSISATIPASIPPTPLLTDANLGEHAANLGEHSALIKQIRRLRTQGLLLGEAARAARCKQVWVDCLCSKRRVPDGCSHSEFHRPRRVSGGSCLATTRVTSNMSPSVDSQLRLTMRALVKCVVAILALHRRAVARSARRVHAPHRGRRWPLKTQILESARLRPLARLHPAWPHLAWLRHGRSLVWPDQPSLWMACR